MSDNIIILVVPIPPTVTLSPPDRIQGAMVGSPLTIQCIANATNVLDDNDVMFTWAEPGGDTIFNDSRVTIKPTTSSGRNYTSSLQISYLMEGDEGAYTCNVTTFDKTGSATALLDPIIGNCMFNIVFHHVCTSNIITQPVTINFQKNFII